MFSHVMLGANDIAKSKAFYDATLGVLGYAEGNPDPKGRVLWMSQSGMFAITPPINGEPATCGNGSTIGFACNSSEQVNAWHAAGVAAGGTSIEDAPGIRDMGLKLYLAYLRDPAGNKLCAMHMLKA